jgi:PAS domain S-box-containing protein
MRIKTPVVDVLQEKLRRSEAYLAEGQRLSHTGSWAVSVPGGEIFWSDEVFRICGLDPATTTLSLEMAFQLIHPDDRPQVRESFGRAVRDKTDYVIESRAILPDGSVRQLLAIGHPILNDAGVVVECIGTVADITERKHAEAAARKTHERLEMILASIPDRFFAVDSDWRYTHFNTHAAEQLRALGKDAANLLGRSLWDEFPNPQVGDALRRAMSERVAIVYDHYYAPLGEWVEQRIYPSTDGGLAIFVTYVTERKRAEEELQELTTRLIEAQEAQSKHVARELHDVLSQNLAVIGMEIGRMAHSSSGVDQALKDRLLGITHQIRGLATDIHRMSRQIHPAMLGELGLTAAIKSECLAFSERYGMLAQFTSQDIPDDLAEGISLCLYRIAQESLRNIGKHGGVSEVRVRLSHSSNEIRLTIDDAGHGFTVETIKGKRGLGLVSMEERLRIVGGTLSITSRPGSGTHVEARVPIARSS